MGHRVFFVLAIIFGAAIMSGAFGGGVALAASTKIRKVCSATPAAGWARCNSSIVTDSGGVVPLASGAPQGYGPANFKAAYGVRGTAVTHVGIVVAYDAPRIQTDLTAYSRTYGLPVPAVCTAAMQAGCFEKLNQRGGASYPVADSSWAVEASMDVESAHGMCPECQISLVEASSASMNNLSTAVDEAAVRGAKVISNSYGGGETTGQAAYDSHYRKAGIALVASSGDSGYGTSYPAAAPTVVAVGGTSLKMSGSRVVSETAWSGAGSGCSQFEPKPSWQADKKCVRCSIADVSADADPNTGAAIYDSYANSGHSGWFTVGGTSLAAPLVVGIVAASGLTANQPASIYAKQAASIRDIVSGSNGSCSTYFCKASTSYDGPTGLGVLNRL